MSPQLPMTITQNIPHPFCVPISSTFNQILWPTTRPFSGEMKKELEGQSKEKQTERAPANFLTCRSFACSNLERVSEYTSDGKRIPGSWEDAVAMQDTWSTT